MFRNVLPTVLQSLVVKILKRRALSEVCVGVGVLCFVKARRASQEGKLFFLRVTLTDPDWEELHSFGSTTTLL